MGATNSTANLDLPQFVDADKPTWRGDFNGAMADIDSAHGALTGRATALEGRATSLEGRATALETGKVDRARIAVNVKDYGAIGDGVADDRAAIQTALDDSLTVYFPPGTYALKSMTIAGDRILKVRPGHSLIGHSDSTSILRIGDALGNYMTVIGMLNDATYVGKFNMSNLCVDQNAANNPIDIANKATKCKMVVRLGSYNDTTSKITVRDCTFVNTDNINTIYVYGRVCQIRGNTFLNHGRVVGTVNYDHSSVYATCTDSNGVINICNNDFLGLPNGNIASAGAVTAIETHGGIQVISNNAISLYFTGVNVTGVNPSLSAGTNLVCNGAIVSNNSMSRVCIGVHVWSWYATGGAVAGVNMRDVSVTNNMIDIDRDAYMTLTTLLQYATGVLVNPNNTAPIHGLAINGNTISYRASTTAPASDQNSSGINLTLANAAAPIYDLEILGNKIINPLSTGMNLNAVGGIIRGEIANNRVVNPGCSTGGIASIYASFAVIQKILRDVDFHHNRLYDDRAPHIAAYGINTPGTIVECTNVKTYDNFIRFYDGVTPPCFLTPANVAGTYMWIDEPADIATLPGLMVKIGSRIRELTTGKIYTQTVSPQGATWKLSADLGVTTGTVAPAAGGAGALPATPAGYKTVSINGTDQKVAYY